MWYRGYPYRRRWRRRGFGGFPFILFFIIFLAGHSFAAFLIGIAVSIALSILLAALFRAGSVNTPPTSQTYYQPPQQQYTPYYQPYNQPYQSNQPYQQQYQPYQQEYQPYEQGYQPPQPAKYAEADAQDQLPQAPSRYEEQPQAEYPRELPPMEQ
jgi:glucan phosphoethanolaminetransferase (alkaline phosphatase superfamily)